MSDMELRDYFAAHCPDSWLEMAMPKTIGDIRDALIARGLIPKDRQGVDVMRAYTDKDRRCLWILLRYDYADAMIEAATPIPTGERR